jgi:hypothetical protein
MSSGYDKGAPPRLRQRPFDEWFAPVYQKTLWITSTTSPV